MELLNGTTNKFEKIVADTNIIIAAILHDGDTRKIFCSTQVHFFAPERIIIKIKINETELLQKKNQSKAAFDEKYQLIFNQLTIIPHQQYESYQLVTQNCLPRAHQDDWPFIALALHLNCPLWSNDLALKQQKVVPVYTTKELIQHDESAPN